MIPTETADFIRALYYHSPRHKGYLTLTALHPTRRAPPPSRHIPLHHKRDVKEALEALLNANKSKDWGAFFAVAVRHSNLGRWQRGTKSDLLLLPALYVDIDQVEFYTLENIRTFNPQPSSIIKSGAGFHVYWWIEPTHDFETATGILRGLSVTLHGDSSLSIAQSMRLPGSVNTKPHLDKPPCTLIELSDARYSLSDFSGFFLEKPLPAEQRPGDPPRYIQQSVIPRNGELNKFLIDEVIRTLYLNYGGFSQQNGWIGAICPLGHKHDAPGRHFGFNPSKGIGHCFGRHKRIYLVELCKLLNISNPQVYAQGV